MTKLIAFLHHIGFPKPELEFVKKQIKESGFHMTEPVLAIVAGRIGKPYEELREMYDSYTPPNHN